MFGYVEGLLASPHYGERWGRYWLDVARYADTKGYVFQEERRYPFAYTYRDWVIRAFNDDMPYDQFLVRQIAADRLEEGGLSLRPRAARTELERASRRHAIPDRPRRRADGDAEDADGDHQPGRAEDDRDRGDAMRVRPHRDHEDERDGRTEDGPGLETQDMTEVADGAESRAEHARRRDQTDRQLEA